MECHTSAPPVRYIGSFVLSFKDIIAKYVVDERVKYMCVSLVQYVATERHG